MSLCLLCQEQCRNLLKDTVSECIIWAMRADAVPILLRLIFHKNFTPGPFKLGRAQPFINIIAIVWLTFSLVRRTAPSVSLP